MTDLQRPAVSRPLQTVLDPTLLEATAAPSMSSAWGRGARICKQACWDAFTVSRSAATALAAGRERHSRHMRT